jgi:predicted nicotinamide N-methyase
MDVVSLTTIPIELGGEEYCWYRVRDASELLDQAALASADSGDAEIAELDPFWAATWRAAIGLDRFLERMNCRDVEFLELGCGSGQAGVGAATRGGRVTMTDAVPLALKVAELNAFPVRARIEFQKLHWAKDVLPRKFPVILGSDLVYDISLFESLLDCAAKHLAEDGTLLLSEPHRHTGDYFAQYIKKLPWNVSQHDVDLGDDRVAIRIFECKMTR